jgi:hypothetical protein
MYAPMCKIGIFEKKTLFLDYVRKVCTVPSLLFMAGLFGLHNPNPPTWNHDAWASDVK